MCSPWQCWCLLCSRFGCIAVTGGIGYSPQCQQKQENRQMERCGDPPGLSAPTPPQASPPPGSVHRMKLSSPFGLATVLLIWVTQSPYRPRKRWVRSAKHIPALTPTEFFFVFRLVGTEPASDPYLGAKQGLTLFHFTSWCTLPSPCSSKTWVIFCWWKSKLGVHCSRNFAWPDFPLLVLQNTYKRY